MEPSFWRERWAMGQTGWQEPAPNHFLVRHHGVLGLGPGRRVLVPLAGKSPDLAFLAEQGAEVIAVELVEAAAQAFFDERGLATARTVEAAHVRIAAGPIAFLVGDFFELAPADVGPVDAVYDRASLVALPPTLRDRYAAHLAVLAATALRLTVTFAHDAPADAPPFSVQHPELERLFGAGRAELLGERDLFQPGGGLAARGATFTRELCHLVRP
jgi:thiopurine S-methyltransferase